jgi:hypothetical protein
MGYAPVDVRDPKTGIVRKEIPLMENVHGKKVTGGSFPAQIWKKFMAEALKGSKHSDFPTPKLGGEVLAPPAPECPEPTSPGGGSGADGQDGDDAEVAFRPAALSVDTDGDGIADSPDPDCEVEPTPSPSPTPSIEFCGPFICLPGQEPDDFVPDDTRPPVPTLPRRSPCFPFECPPGASTTLQRNTTTTKPPGGGTTTTPNCFPFCDETTTTLPVEEEDE